MTFPLVLQQEKFDHVIGSKLNLSIKDQDMTEWKQFVNCLHDKTLQTVNIGIVGKYVNYSDCYISVVESLKHACVHNNVTLKVHWVDSEFLSSENVDQSLSSLDGILVPGGFGERGVEGKILASKFAREHNVPYLGLCLGMHVASIDIARHLLNKTDAHSSEFKPSTDHPIIHLLESQEDVSNKGGTMRLGSFDCQVVSNTRLHAAYQSSVIKERHRHRYMNLIILIGKPSRKMGLSFQACLLMENLLK